MHTHIGQYFGMYIDAKMLSYLMSEVGVEKYAVSSTTICEHNYQKVLDEFHSLIDIDGGKVLPTLWITSRMLADDKEAMFVDSDIDWKIIKIHPAFEEDFWQTQNAVMDYVVAIAKDINVPILIHTDEWYNCNPFNFEHIIRRHPTQAFILAHGRPLNTTIQILHKYDNTYVDTSFMPMANIKQLVDKNLSNRILWGSDSCIVKWNYPDINLVDEYNSRLADSRQVIPYDDLNRILNLNAVNLFSTLNQI